MGEPQPTHPRIANELALLLVLATLWGASYTFLKVAVATIPPITLIAGRTLIAGLLLMGADLSLAAEPGQHYQQHCAACHGAQRTGGIADASKHIFELSTLLQEHGERGLTSLQTGKDIGKLRGYAAHGGGCLFCANARLALSCIKLADGGNLLLERLGRGVDATGFS